MSQNSKKNSRDDLDSFLQKLNMEMDPSRFYEFNEYIYYLPVGARICQGIHYIRTGILLGRVRNGRFEPSQAFAMELTRDKWKDPLDLKADDPRVLKYLKCETIDADEEASGYRLVCVDSHPLGWVKQSGYKCKNKYYPGWRYE